jgi:hypothetical protein
MFVSMIKIASATVLLLALASTGLRPPATCAAVSAAVSNASFHVTINNVLSDDSALVSQVRIEALPGSTIELLSDEKHIATTLSAQLGAPIHPNEPSSAELTLFADLVEPEARKVATVKFLIGFKAGSISSSRSSTKPMPAGATELADVMKLHIMGGDYNYGEAVKLATYTGHTYSLLVRRTS